MHEVDALMRRHRQHQRLVKCVGSGWQVGRAGERERESYHVVLRLAHWQFVHLPSPLVVAAVHVLPASVSVCVSLI